MHDAASVGYFYIHPAALDGGGAEGAYHAVGVFCGHVNKAHPVLDVYRADGVAGDVGFVGDCAHYVARPDPGFAPQVYHEPQHAMLIPATRSTGGPTARSFIRSSLASFSLARGAGWRRLYYLCEGTLSLRHHLGSGGCYLCQVELVGKLGDKLHKGQQVALADLLAYGS